ncbi:hypothetical protein [Pseudoalteromonas sp. MMG005]|uniref:hypothetical protein n=1 Tax=Pseudoalteromonas sp. MMG005 TaxID=2822682 RepID=UPI001B39EA52|nr:hypothetical protein [Pseudoalteromonas sp. MMG005]MBQ4844938.1 hypothetical protein [Pseudoalteromonas sp. MMG005]
MSTQVSSLSSSSDFSPTELSGNKFGGLPFTITPPAGKRVKLTKLLPDSKTLSAADVAIFIDDKQISPYATLSVAGGIDAFYVDVGYYKFINNQSNHDQLTVYTSIIGKTDESISIKQKNGQSISLELAWEIGD